MKLLFNFKFQLQYMKKKKKGCFPLPFHQSIKKTDSLSKGYLPWCIPDIFKHINMVLTVTIFQKYTASKSTHCRTSSFLINLQLKRGLTYIYLTMEGHTSSCGL